MIGFERLGTRRGPGSTGPACLCGAVTPATRRTRGCCSRKDWRRPSGWAVEVSRPGRPACSRRSARLLDQPLRVDCPFGRAGVGRLRQVVKARRQRVDEGLQPRSLGNDPQAHLIESCFGAAHDAIVAHDRQTPRCLERSSRRGHAQVVSCFGCRGPRDSPKPSDWLCRENGAGLCPRSRRSLRRQRTYGRLARAFCSAHSCLSWPRCPIVGCECRGETARRAIVEAILKCR